MRHSDASDLQGLTQSTGSLSEIMGELEGATSSYERALTFNAGSVPAMMAISCILRAKDSFPAAVEYLKQILRLEPTNGEVWSSLGTLIITAVLSPVDTDVTRSLLPHDGRPSAGILRISAGPLPPSRSQGKPDPG